MKLTLKQVEQFLTEHQSQIVSAIEPLSGGEWSQAFGFKEAGKDYVVRFGQHHNDYLKDKMASRFTSVNLPIPEVFEVGAAFNGYYAISDRAFGTMIDNLDKPAMRRVVPSLFETMDAIRQTDISGTSGFGEWDNSGAGKYSSWYDVLVDVINDRPDSKIYGWKAGLKGSPIGDGPFNEAYAQLTQIAKDIPEVRTLVHNDLVNFNVLVNDDHISAIFDWANALYGDFLYDLAQFTFWGAIHPPIMGIDWEALAVAHYASIGLAVPMFKERLQCCMINMGLGAQAYYGFKKDWQWLEPVAQRTLEIARA